VSTQAYRVASRFLFGDAIADPKEDLHKFQVLVDTFCRHEDLAKVELVKLHKFSTAMDQKDFDTARAMTTELKKTNREQYEIKMSVHGGLSFQRIKDVAEPLFWAILQQYVLPPQIRRGVETASRFWSKKKLTLRTKSMRGGYGETAEYLEAYLKLCSMIRKQVTDAQLAIVKGKLHADPEIAAQHSKRVGSFNLINTGGFKDEVMEKAAEVVSKAEKAMQGVGLGKVCYGDILISKTISNKRNIAAFYVVNSDEMFVRANTPTDWDTARVICHELAHRLQFKFLTSKAQEINEVYRTLKTHSFLSKSGIPMEALPKRGEELTNNGETFKVTSIDYMHKKIQFTKAGDPPNIAYSAPAEYWFQLKGVEPHQIPGFKGFITRYAGTNPIENFAEMVSFYALGKLPDDQVELLKPILG